MPPWAPAAGAAPPAGGPAPAGRGRPGGRWATLAAVVARGWGIPAVVGAAAVQVGQDAVVIGGHTLAVGETITIDGGSGEIFAGAVAGTVAHAPETATLLRWADELGIAIRGRAARETVGQGTEAGGAGAPAGSAP